MGGSLAKLFSNHKEQVRLLMVGLDAAGKTTILYQLKLGEVITTIPTIGMNVESVETSNLVIQTMDTGGRCRIRPLWHHYYQNTNAIVFVVDSNDRERMPEAAEEIAKMANEELLSDCVYLVLANKQDLANSMSVQQVTDALQLHTSLGSKPWNIFGTSGHEKESIKEALSWLSDRLKKESKSSKSSTSSESSSSSSWSELFKTAMKKITFSSS
eukprot:m.105498 g.105498  ORF g.105498 m.105498 type:complete len:214 (+) comp22494_c0_seq5:113-754(+)